MKLDGFLVALFALMFCIVPSVKPQTCQQICGGVMVKYPFGTGPGCGDVRFQSYVKCNDQQQLTFTTNSGCYPITSVDYSKQIIFISDPSMSTCFCSQPSRGFSLDWNAPFSFHDETVFALLDCSSSSSPIYKSMVDTNSSAHFPLCDSHGADVCKMLYSCQAISSRVNVVPGSSCCVYTPVDLGPSFEMDLEKLQCNSYSGLYGFNGQEFNPGAWSYGVAIKYKFSFDNDYPTMCANCEKSNGICGYTGPYNSYVCYCPNGVNTSSDCFFGSSRSIASRLLPRQTGMLLIYGLAWLFILLVIA